MSTIVCTMPECQTTAGCQCARKRYREAVESIYRATDREIDEAMRAIPVPRGGIQTDWHAACILLHRRFRKLEKAARLVVSETDRIHDNEPWPVKYQAPYAAITVLRETIAEVGSEYPPPVKREVGT